MWYLLITSFFGWEVLYNDTTVSIQWSEFSQHTLWVTVWHRLETWSPYMQLKHLYTVILSYSTAVTWLSLRWSTRMAVLYRNLLFAINHYIMIIVIISTHNFSLFSLNPKYMHSAFMVLTVIYTYLFFNRFCVSVWQGILIVTVGEVLVMLLVSKYLSSSSSTAVRYRAWLPLNLEPHSCPLWLWRPCQ
jgi:hypothetical protein